MKLFDQVHEAYATKHYSPRTEESYTRWINHFLRFHREKAGKWIHLGNTVAREGAGLYFRIPLTSASCFAMTLIVEK